MPDEPSPQDPTPPSTPPPPAPPGETAKDELTRLRDWAQSFAAREKQEGRNSVQKEVAEKLGMTIDQAAALIAKGREAEEASLTEAEKKFKAANEAREEARAARREAHDIILNQLKVDALMDLGMTRQQARASTDLVKVDTRDSVTVESVVEAAGAVKIHFPQLFTATPPPPGGHGPSADRQGPPDSATRGTPQPAPTGNTARDRAHARLIQRHARTNPPSILPRESEINAQRRSS